MVERKLKEFIDEDGRKLNVWCSDTEWENIVITRIIPKALKNKKYTDKELIPNPNGALRESKEGKGRFDLLPYKALSELAKHLENGAKKHGEHNWEKGLNLTDCYSAAIRHALQANGLDWTKQKEDANGESKRYHLRAAMFNIAVILEQMEDD